jgi:UDP-N-acetylmuramoyl-tripeptide--D-alanyl-D-alanine ligase
MGVAQWLTSLLLKGKPAGPLVIEMGAYRKGEIALLCSITKPTLGIVTSVGNQHVALFGSPQAIVEAKGELVMSLPPSGHAFLNADNDGCRAIARRSPCPVTLVGLGRNAQLKATDVRDADGLSLTVDGHTMKTTLRGEHQATNVLLAIAVARHLGIPEKRIAELLQDVRPPKHSFTVFQEGDVTMLDDTHNCSPMSMRAALAWAAARPERPRVLLTSGILELGRFAPATMKEIGAVAKGSVERVIFTANRGREDFEEGFGSPVEELSRSSAKIPKASLLLCVGRMPLSLPKRLLP